MLIKTKQSKIKQINKTVTVCVWNIYFILSVWAVLIKKSTKHLSTQRTDMLER